MVVKLLHIRVTDIIFSTCENLVALPKWSIIIYEKYIYIYIYDKILVVIVLLTFPFVSLSRL